MSKKIKQAKSGMGEFLFWAPRQLNPLKQGIKHLKGQIYGQKMFTNPKIYNANNDPTKNWYVEYTFLNPATNKMQRIKVRQGLNKSGLTLKDKTTMANQLCKAVHELLLEGFSPFADFKGHTVQAARSVIELLNEMLDIKKTNLEIRSYQSYSQVINRFERFLDENKLKDCSAESFTKNEAQLFFDTLQLEGLKNRTINGYISHLKGMFNMLVEREIIEVSPFNKLQRLKTQKNVKNIPMTNEEMKIVFPHIREHAPRLYLLSLFIYYNYIREKELTMLRFSHIDLKNRSIIIPASVAKNDTTQSLPIPESFLTELQNFEFGTYPNKEDFIFSRQLLPGNFQINRNRMSEVWNKIVKKGLGIQKDMYAIKHRSAIDFMAKGGKIRELQVLMRHHSIAQTEQYLASMMPDLNTSDFARKITLDY